MTSARQRSCKHASLIEETCFLCGLCCATCYAVRTKHAVIIETVSSVWSVPRVYKRHGKSMGAVISRVETGSNTSTVALLVVGGDQKGSLESETVKYGHESHATRTRK
jgi:hypothetical protein